MFPHGFETAYEGFGTGKRSRKINHIDIIQIESMCCIENYIFTDIFGFD